MFRWLYPHWNHDGAGQSAFDEQVFTHRYGIIGLPRQMNPSGHSESRDDGHGGASQR